MRPAHIVARRVHTRTLPDGLLAFPAGGLGLTRTGISALGSLWGWGKIWFYLRVTSLPGDNPNPPSGPILDPTVCGLIANYLPLP